MYVFEIITLETLLKKLGQKDKKSLNIVLTILCMARFCQKDNSLESDKIVLCEINLD